MHEKSLSIEPKAQPEIMHEILAESVTEKILEERGIAARAELQQLLNQIEALSSKLDELEDNEKNAG